MKKILICLLISMFCFTPFSFSILAEESSSFVIVTDYTLTSAQVDFLNDNYSSLDSVFIYLNPSGDQSVLRIFDSNLGYISYDSSSVVTYTGILRLLYSDGSFSDSTLLSNESFNFNSSFYHWINFPNNLDGCSVFNNSSSLIACGYIRPPSPSVPDGTIRLEFFVNNPEFGYVASDHITLNEFDEWHNYVTPYDGYEFLYWINTSNGFKFTNRELTGTAFSDNSYVAFLTKENEALNIYLPDFNSLLANPAIASLVQEATNLDTNFWYIDRTIYSYHEPPGCSVNGVVSVGYTEVFELYVINGSSFTLQADSIGSNSTSIYDCSGVQQPGSIDSSPFVREQVLTSFDLWSIPDTDFYEMLIDIYDLIATNPEISYLIQNGQYLQDLLAAYKDQSAALINGTESSNNVSNFLQDSNTSLNDAVSQYDQAEKAFTDDFKVNVDAIDTNFSWGSQFLNSANFVRTSFNELVEPAPIYNMILFSLILGFALFIIGRLR